MIPHRMLSNEISGSGLKERVTACRKRLRVSRVTTKTQALNEACELFVETDLSLQVYESDDFRAPELALVAQEQEVGIT